MTRKREQQNWTMHADLLKSVSRSFFLSIRFLPEAMRDPIAIGYLLARLSDTIADSTAIPETDRPGLLDRYRENIEKLDPGFDLPDIDESFDHEGERHLLRAAPEIIEWLAEASPDNRKAIQKVTTIITAGQKWDIEHFQSPDTTTTEKELLDYTYSVAGCVGEFWTEVGFINLGDQFALQNDRDMLMTSGKKLGQGLQLINIIRDLHEDLPVGRNYLPDNDIDHWLSRCRSFLNDGRTYLTKVKNRKVRFATALPLYLAKATADKLEAAGAEEIRRRKIKVPRSTVWKLAGKAALFS